MWVAFYLPGSFTLDAYERLSVRRRRLLRDALAERIEAMNETERYTHGRHHV
jgi:hypothetical protein